MSQIDTLKGLLAERPLITRRNFADAGVHPQTIARAIESGLLTRAATGVFAHPEAFLDPDFDYAVACLATGGVVARRTAGKLHDLTEDLDNAIEMLVPHGHNISSSSTLPIRLIRTRVADALTVGVESHEVLGQTMRMTSKARTVVDLGRAPALRQHFLTALTKFLSDGGAGSELDTAAAIYGSGRWLAPYKAATLETLKGGQYETGSL